VRPRCTTCLQHGERRAILGPFWYALADTHIHVQTPSTAEEK
jgi:hypothetical protein